VSFYGSFYLPLKSEGQYELSLTSVRQNGRPEKKRKHRRQIHTTFAEINHGSENDPSIRFRFSSGHGMFANIQTKHLKKREEIEA